MAEALKIVSVERGHDPRDFSLAAFGGAGPMHAVALAEELGIAEVVCPPIPGAFSALGLVGTDLKRDYVRSVAQPLPQVDGPAGRDDRIGELAALLEAQARAALDAEGFSRSRQRLRFSLDLRYLGQYHEVNVGVPAKLLKEGAWDGIRRLFHRQHDRMYGYSLADDGTVVEILNLRLAAIGVTVKPAPERQARVAASAARALKGERPAYQPDRKAFRTVSVFDGDRLRHGHRVAGPAIIESVNTTIVVPGGYLAEYDEQGNCLLGAR